MYKLCKTEQSAARQRELESGLLKIMQTTRYEDILVSDLCDQLQIPRKSFYRYFTSKDGALQALLDHTLMEFEAYTVSYQRGHVRTIHLDLESFFQFWLVHKNLLDALARSGITGMLIERAIAFALTDDILPRRFLPNDGLEMQRHITMFTVCGLMSLVLSWYTDSFAKPASEMARMAVRMLGQPLFPQADCFVV